MLTSCSTTGGEHSLLLAAILSKVAAWSSCHWLQHSLLHFCPPLFSITLFHCSAQITTEPSKTHLTASLACLICGSRSSSSLGAASLTSAVHAASRAATLGRAASGDLHTKELSFAECSCVPCVALFELWPELSLKALQGLLECSGSATMC